MHRPAKRTGKPGVFAPVSSPHTSQAVSGVARLHSTIEAFRIVMGLSRKRYFCTGWPAYFATIRAPAQGALSLASISPHHGERLEPIRRETLVASRAMFWTMREGCGLLVRPRHDPPRFVGSTPRRFERPMPLVETCSRYALSTLLNVSLRPGSTDCPLSCSQHRAPRPPLRHGWRRFLRVAPVLMPDLRAPAIAAFYERCHLVHSLVQVRCRRLRLTPYSNCITTAPSILRRNR